MNRTRRLALIAFIAALLLSPLAAIAGDTGSASADVRAVSAVTAGDIAHCTEAHYSFGTTVTSGGVVLFTEFNRRQIRSWNPNTGHVDIWRAKKTPGMFGLASSTAGDVFVGLDLGDTGNPGKVLWIGADFQEQYIIEKITRPRQLTCDGAGNLFVVLEGGAILKWDKVARTLTEIMTAHSPVSGIALGADGSVYVSEYGAFDTAPEGHSRPSIPGRVKVKRPNGDVVVLAKGFWRARGLAISGRKLYLCTESNREDQGNAGQLVCIDTVTGTYEILLDKLDYPQFPAVSADGRIYFTLGRDNCLVVFDPATPFHDTACPVDGVARLTVRGGRIVWGDSHSGIPFSIHMQAMLIRGLFQPTSGSQQMEGWIEIPADRFHLNTSDLYPRHDSEHPAPGVFELPKSNSQCGRGGIQVEVFPLRRHQGRRWPMQNVGTSEESPAPGFNEQPKAFRFYFRWRQA